MPELKDVTLHLGNKIILDHFSIVIPSQGITCLSGPSGCGKTTLIRVLTGLVQPDTGEVRGLEKGQVALLFQEDRLLPWRTAQENIADVLAKNNKDQVDMWLQEVELLEDAATYPNALSGGMRRRVALARALAYCMERPGPLDQGGRMLLLDEPFKGLDPALRARMMQLVKRQHVPTLLISHDAEEINIMADRVFYLEGPPLQIKTEAVIESESPPCH